MPSKWRRHPDTERVKVSLPRILRRIRHSHGMHKVRAIRLRSCCGRETELRRPEVKYSSIHKSAQFSSNAFARSIAASDCISQLRILFSPGRASSVCSAACCIPSDKAKVNTGCAKSRKRTHLKLIHSFLINKINITSSPTNSILYAFSRPH